MITSWAKRAQNVESSLAALEKQEQDVATVLGFCPRNRTAQNAPDELLTITVIGEFNAGKSTLINALLGHNILPTGIVPTTATINVVVHGPTPSVNAKYIDGHTEALEYSQEAMERFKATKGTFEDISCIDITSPQAPQGCRIIDTPGVNDICQTRMDIVYGFIPQSDAVVFVMDIEQALKKSEIDFLKERVLGSSLSSVLFVLNHADRVTASESDELCQAIEEKLRSVYDDIAHDLSQRNCQTLVDQVQLARRSLQVFPISAKSVVKDGTSGSDPQFLRLSAAIADIVGGSNARNIRLRKRISLMALDAQEMRLQLDSIKVADTESERAFTERLDRFASEIESTAVRVGEVSAKLSARLQALQSDSRSRLLCAFDALKGQVWDEAAASEGTDVASKAEAAIRKVVEAEAITVRSELVAIAGDWAQSLNLSRLGSIDLSVPGADQMQFGFDPMDGIIMAVAEILGLVLFGPWGLLAGPILAFLRVTGRQGDARTQFNEAFEKGVGRLLAEQSAALDHAGDQIRSMSLRSFDEVMVPLRAALESHNGVRPVLDVAVVEKRLSEFARSVDGLSKQLQ